MPTWADLKQQARRVVHSTFGVPATYEDDSVITPVPVSVRWHTRQVREGDPEQVGYPEIIEGVDKIVFSADNLADAGITPTSQGVVTIAAYNLTLVLQVLDPNDGPVTQTWSVSRQ